MTVAAWPNRLQPIFGVSHVDDGRFIAGSARPAGLAVLLWSLSPALALLAFPTPPLLLLAIGFGAGFLVHAGHRRLAGGRVADLFGASFGIMAAAVIGIAGASLCCVLALRLAAGSQAAIASHLAPAGIVLAAGLLLAVCAAAAARLGGGGLQHQLGGVCGISAPLCLMLHLGLEPRIALEAGNLLAAAALGIGPFGLAGILWERAKSGDGRRSLARVGSVSGAALRHGAGGR